MWINTKNKTLSISLKLPNAEEFKLKYKKPKRDGGDGNNNDDKIDVFDINKALNEWLGNTSKKSQKTPISTTTPGAQAEIE